MISIFFFKEGTLTLDRSIKTELKFAFETFAN